MSTRPGKKIKDKIKFEFNPITGKLDLVSEFNPDKIVTHSLNPFANPIQWFDPIHNIYYYADDQVVTDDDGNIVEI